ncbi:MAG: V-type ATP synthase subunit D [Clostridiales bacterium]|nr:V-type ATP synthase subunit D [Clostridiales bacterium]MBD5086123.1 V-type ATP synthase subunit D [Clostridiales bacterium]MBD5100970.1 V-type ATP synthase subunit D [Clostridiales bacterium]
MARLQVNPTRMELKRLKARLKTAERGHKLLKDKSDEMIRRFMEYAKENKRLREQVEKELSTALTTFIVAKAVSDDAVVQEAVAMPSKTLKLEMDSQNVMSVVVPVIKVQQSSSEDKYPYSFSSVTAELDSSIEVMGGMLERMVKLAEIEKTCNMLAIEIEKNRRRVNALEYVMIPQLQETIKFITMKLDENERSNIVRLVKVKSLIKKESV